MWPRLWRKLLSIHRRAQFERDLADELEFHGAMKRADAENAGKDPSEAHYFAQREMGNVVEQKEASREAWIFTTAESVIRDARYAIRVSTKTPLFTACAILTLALGIGANAAIFTLIDTLLLRGVPGVRSGEAVEIGLDRDRFTTPVDLSTFEDLQARARSFSGMFSWESTNFSTGWGADAKHLRAATVSGNVYEVLRLHPEVGRLLTPADDVTGAPLAAVISDGFWSSRFNRDPSAIGKTIFLERHAFTIVGVTPPGFYGVVTGINTLVTISFHASAVIRPNLDLLHNRGLWFLQVFARLRNGVSEASAQAEMRAITLPIMRDQLGPGATARVRKMVEAQTLEMVPAAQASWIARTYGGALAVLICLSGLVLLLACVNLAGLSLARAAARQKELSVRLAIGAGRHRLVRQLLLESIVLSVAGAALGGILALWATHGLLGMLSYDGAPLVVNLNPDWRVWGFLALLAVGTGVLFGSAPAFTVTDLKPIDALKQSGIGFAAGGNRFWLGRSLVTLQIGISVLLLSGAILFSRTLGNLKSQNPGFRAENLLSLDLDLSNASMNHDQRRHFSQALLDRVRAVPFVQSDSITDFLPISGSLRLARLDADLWPRLTPAERQLYVHHVEPDYFQTLGIRLLAGRDFRRSDEETGADVIILSRSAADTYVPGQNPIGRILRESPTRSHRIIGIVDDAKYADMRTAPPRTVYLPNDGSRPLVVRAGADRYAVPAAVRAIIRDLGKDVVVSDPVSMTEEIDGSLVSERLIALLSSFFVVLAALLVAIGLYGIVAYSASRRTSEIGLRLALGATRPQVLWMVMRQAIALALLGLMLGIPAALAWSPRPSFFVRSHGTRRFDPRVHCAGPAAHLRFGWLSPRSSSVTIGSDAGAAVRMTEFLQ